MIPYGKQSIDEKDINQVVESLKSDFLTTGPTVQKFEQAFAEYVGAKYAVAVSNGTAALHLSCLAAGLGEGDELITTPMTFAASANCAFYCGAKPIFVDVNEFGNIDESKIESKITSQTKILIPVHYTGLCANMEKISEIAQKHNLVVIEDACHALGGIYGGHKVGSCQFSDMTVFSFHPVKHITTGEGGMITTNNHELYHKLLRLRSHGITKDPTVLESSDEGPWHQEMHELGFNYRLTDIQSALGLNQLKKIDPFVKKRREIAKRYQEAFENMPEINYFAEPSNTKNSYHLFVIKTSSEDMRKKLFTYLADKNIRCQVHYLPVYLHPFYQKQGYPKGLCPQAEKLYHTIISLPIYPLLQESEQDFVITTVKEFFKQQKTQN